MFPLLPTGLGEGQFFCLFSFSLLFLYSLLILLARDQ